MEGIMREQLAHTSNFGTQSGQAEHQPTRSTGRYVGRDPDDLSRQTDDYQTRHTRGETLSDDWEEPRSPSSTRRYQGGAIQQATPRSLIRVTDHRGQPSASEKHLESAV